MFQRNEVTEIRALGRGRSAAVGTTVGFGIGAAGGALVGLAINSGDKGSYVHVSSGKAVGVGAALGGTALAIVGSLIGYSRDSFGGPILYRRP